MKHNNTKRKVKTTTASGQLAHPQYSKWRKGQALLEEDIIDAQAELMDEEVVAPSQPFFQTFRTARKKVEKRLNVNGRAELAELLDKQSRRSQFKGFFKGGITAALAIAVAVSLNGGISKKQVVFVKQKASHERQCPPPKIEVSGKNLPKWQQKSYEEQVNRMLLELHGMPAQLEAQNVAVTEVK